MKNFIIILIVLNKAYHKDSFFRWRDKFTRMQSIRGFCHLFIYLFLKFCQQCKLTYHTVNLLRLLKLLLSDDP